MVYFTSSAYSEERFQCTFDGVFEKESGEIDTYKTRNAFFSVDKVLKLPKGYTILWTKNARRSRIELTAPKGGLSTFTLISLDDRAFTMSAKITGERGKNIPWLQPAKVE